MARKVISVGAINDDGTGDALRAGGIKINDNMEEIYRLLGMSPRFGLIRSRRLVGFGGGNWGAFPTNITVQNTWGLEGDFDLVRLVFENDSATTYAVTAATVCPVAQENSSGGYIPLDKDGATQAWTSVTFNAAGADTLPPQATGSTATFTVPAITGTNVKSYSFSDWIRVSSIPPHATFTNQNLRLLATRVYFSGAGRGQYAWSATETSFNSNSVSLGRIIATARVAGNATTTTTALSSPTKDGTFTPQGVQYYSRARGATVMALGDSITQGEGTASYVASYGHTACANVSVPGTRPVSFVNAGWTGQTSLQVHDRGVREIDAFRPDVVAIMTFTPNDGQPTQAIVNLAWSRAMSLAHYAISKGAVPILLTPAPWSSTTSATDPFRRQLTTRANALAATGAMLVCDVDTVLSDGADPARFKTAYNNDGIHPNEAGHAAMAAAFEPVLRLALGM